MYGKVILSNVLCVVITHPYPELNGGLDHLGLGCLADYYWYHTLNDVLIDYF